MPRFYEQHDFLKAPAEPRYVSWIRAAVVGLWHYEEDIDPFLLGHWTQEERENIIRMSAFVDGLIRLETEVVSKFGTLDTYWIHTRKVVQLHTSTFFYNEATRYPYDNQS